jgi:perosamine synthetase
VIPVHRPVIGEAEIANVLEALRAGEISGSCGRFITEFEGAFAQYCGCKHGVAVSSGSTALHLACVLANIRPGDEVLVSAGTNIASANAIVQQGGIVVPIDVEPDTWNMDCRLLEAAITPRTKAVMPVHLYGHPVDMGHLLDVALRHGLFVIEDCAEAHGATVRGDKVGGLGDVGCFSFYANKVITTGEGGMLTTNDGALAARARLLRNLAFTTPRFWHEECGFNYRMTNVEAAIGLGQFGRIEGIIARKRELAAAYTERLSAVSWLRLPVEREWARNVYWMYGVVVDHPLGQDMRDQLRARLASAGIDTRTMFCPLNLQPALRKRHAVRTLSCPVAESLWKWGLYLPSSYDLTEAEIDRVCRVVSCA